MYLFAQSVKHFLLDFKIFKAHEFHVLQTLLDQLCDWVLQILKALGIQQIVHFCCDSVEWIGGQNLPR